MNEKSFSLNPIPRFYCPPQGLPLYWRDETSGQLSAAIFRYLNFVIQKVSTPPTDEQIWLIRCYLEHFIMAPCWVDCGDNSLNELRKIVKDVNSVEAINDWLRKASEIALDPLQTNIRGLIPPIKYDSSTSYLACKSSKLL